MKPLTIAVVGDSHYDQRSRFEECIRVHNWIAVDMRERGVDAMFHAGDLFERGSTPAEREAAADWLTEVASFAEILAVRGNHDALGDLSIFKRLDTRNPITIEEAAGVHMLNPEGLPPLLVGALAWPRKGELLARVGTLGPEASSATAAEALRTVLRGFAAEFERVGPSYPRILVAHAMVRGSVTSHGQPLVGCDMEIGLEDLSLARADVVALGHIHKGQDWQFGEMPIFYPGSPRRTAFGESEPKGYVLVTWDPSVCGCPQGYQRGTCPVCRNRGAWNWERVETPATRMEHVEATWRDGAFVFEEKDRPDASALVGAEVRFRYHVPADQREAAAAEAAAWEREALDTIGAIAVKVEELVQPTTRARAPEISSAPGIGDQLRALWASRGEELGPEREARLIAMAIDLERAARA